MKFNYSPPPGVETKNQWGYTSTLPICLHGVDKGFTFVTHAYDKRPIRIRVTEKSDQNVKHTKQGGNGENYVTTAFVTCIYLLRYEY